MIFKVLNTQDNIFIQGQISYKSGTKAYMGKISFLELCLCFANKNHAGPYINALTRAPDTERQTWQQEYERAL